MHSNALITQILHDPAASDWLKDALRTARDRDVLDAFHDARALVSILQQRWQETLPAMTDTGLSGVATMMELQREIEVTDNERYDDLLEDDRIADEIEPFDKPFYERAAFRPGGRR